MSENCCENTYKNEVSIQAIGDSMRMVINLGDGARIMKPIIPDVINVEQPNNKTVFVQFADGSKEVAVCSEDDTFSFETGVLICLFKKVMSKFAYGFGVTGSTIYNKMIKYAMSKKDATKKARMAMREAEKQMAKERHEENIRQRRIESEKKKDDVQMYKQAIIEAITEFLASSGEE